MNKNNFNYIFFDLDGTLTDSAEGITKCAQICLASLGIDETLENLQSFIGPSLRYSFKKYVGDDKEKIEKLLVKYRERYEKIGWKENKLYDGIYELTRDLNNAGKHLVLASAKPELFCKWILEYFGISEFFEFIGGATFDGLREDKADIINYCLDNIGNPDKSQVIMVGDRNYDIFGAHKVGVKSVGVEYGFAPKGELKKAGADFIANTVKDLYNILL